MKPPHLALARFPDRPTTHPSGASAVVAVRRVDLDDDDYLSQLWLVPTTGGAPRRITHGAKDASPAYAPDGTTLAFLRGERDDGGKVGKPQIWLMPTDSGEPQRLTDHPAGVGSFAWSADSTRIAFLARDREHGRYGTVEGIDPDKEPPRRITRFSYRMDDLGFSWDRPRHIWVTDLDGVATPITSGDIDHDEIRWSPDGTLLTFTASGHEDRYNDLRSDVWVCAPDGSGLRMLTRGGFSVGKPAFRPDGTALLFTGNTIGDKGVNAVVLNTSLWSVPVDGSAEPVRLSDEETFNVDGPLEVVADGVIVTNESRGSVELLRFGYDGGEPERLVTGDRITQSFSVAETPDGPVIVATYGDPGTWGEVLLREPDGTERVLTDFNAEYRATVPIFPSREITATAPDGYPVHGWVVRPSGDGPHPLLLLIHGGPFAAYGPQLFDEAQVYAGAGYAVLMSNPRGSAGYGQAHGRVIIGDVGAKSTVDLMAILDEALTAPDLDASRVGVLGGSHGGFMATWLAAHEGHRFRAAVSERAVNAIDSFTGSSDIGWFFADDLYGPDPEGQRRQSPLTYANDIDVPMLIIHSEHDWRCPVEQAQRLYVALKRGGKTVEMLLFPGEGHELTRSGLPSHRVARFDAIVEWFGRYI